MKCKQCGTKYEKDARFCGGCGLAIAPADLANDPPAEPPIDSPAPASPPAHHAYPESPPKTVATAQNPPAGQVVPPPGEAQQTIPAPDAAQQPFTPPVASDAQYSVAENYAHVQQTLDGNSSGMGLDHNLPPESQGWSFAGFVPFGLFAFLHNNVLWGLIYWAGTFIPFASLIYAIYIGVKGKELAWKGRRFASVGQFEETMKAWNTWGLVLLILGTVGLVLVIVLYAAIIIFAISAAGI